MDVSARYGRGQMALAAISSFLRAPLAAILEYSSVTGSSSRAFAATASASNHNIHSHLNREISIRIVGVGHDENHNSVSADHVDHQQGAALTNVDASSENPNPNSNGENGESGYNDYLHCLARWIERILPFSLLLLLVFIRQHLQGFFATIWIAALSFKSNDILQKQVALKLIRCWSMQEERKIYVLLGITLSFLLHIISVYWWHRNEDLIYPLILLPPKKIPSFWHSVFIILVNGNITDVMVQQAAMAFKCVLLIYYKNIKDHNYRKQGQILTLAEYFLLLYRTLLPTPVWYRFFLNKEYGSFFSSLTTGLYLTLKLTSIVEKVQLLFAALRAVSNKEVQYGSRATSEQVKAAGDLCAICQEKMQSPILLSCKHIFCEECVLEWFERERTCPLCRRLVKAAGIKSYADGSTNLANQLF